MHATTFSRRAVLALIGTGLVAACAGQQSTGQTAATAAAAASGSRSRVTARGSFVGKSDHVTTGHASVYRQGGQWIIELEDDFTHDGAPDPKVALGSDGFRQDAILGPLQSLSGRQVYAVPASLDIGDYNEVWIWCEQFSVPLGKAALTLT